MTGRRTCWVSTTSGLPVASGPLLLLLVGLLLPLTRLPLAPLAPLAALAALCAVLALVLALLLALLFTVMLLATFGPREPFRETRASIRLCAKSTIPTHPINTMSMSARCMPSTAIVSSYAPRSRHCATLVLLL